MNDPITNNPFFDTLSQRTGITTPEVIGVLLSFLDHCANAFHGGQLIQGVLLEDIINFASDLLAKKAKGMRGFDVIEKAAEDSLFLNRSADDVLVLKAVIQRVMMGKQANSRTW